MERGYFMGFWQVKFALLNENPMFEESMKLTIIDF